MCYIGACRRLQGRANFHGYVCIGEVGLSLGNVTSIDIQSQVRSLFSNTSAPVHPHYGALLIQRNCHFPQAAVLMHLSLRHTSGIREQNAEDSVSPCTPGIKLGSVVGGQILLPFISEQ